MASVDAGIKYKGLALEAEYYWRWLSDFRGTNTAGIADIDDHGFQVQSSAMVVPRTLQVYLSGSKILGRYGDPSELRAGLNWYPGQGTGDLGQRGVDPPERVSRRVRVGPLSRGRQRGRLPRELRAELLIEKDMWQGRIAQGIAPRTNGSLGNEPST